MSGVFGVVDARHGDESLPLLADMAHAMRHFDWYVTEHAVVEHNLAGLGRIGIGIFNPQPQPVWNADRNLAMCMAGEIYAVTGHTRPPGASDEQWALQLYETCGEGFARLVNGAFVIAIWDGRTQKLVLTNDRFNTYNLFYACANGRLVFGPEMKAILCDPGFHRNLDLTAMAQFMRFQHLFGRRTFFEDLHLLPPASVLTFDASTSDLQLTPYWSFGDIPYLPNISFQEAVEETGRLLRQAVRRFSEDQFRPGVFLSGGMDGRTIIGLTERRPITSLTFGAKDCKDVYYARKIAKAVGSQNHWVELKNGKWVLENIDAHFALTEGFHSWIHMHGMSMLPLARQHIDVNLTGWDGGTVIGGEDTVEPLQMDPVDDEALITLLFQLNNQRFTWPGLTEAEENLLFTQPYRKLLAGRAFDSLREEFEPFRNCRRDIRCEYFYQARSRWFNMIIFGRSHIEYRFPFYDYDLIDFVYSLPSALRADRMLYRAVLRNEAPRLANIPYDHDDLPPTANRFVRSTATWNRRIRHAINRHIAPIFPIRPTLYADYENYLRTDLREWAEGILYDPIVEQQGIFRPEFLRTIMARHLSGRELWTIGKVAPIITYEMMLQRFC